MKLITTLLLLASFAVAQDEKKKAEPVPAAGPAKKAEPNPVVVMRTSAGDIEIELFAKDAPKTVANFIELANGTKPFTDPKTNQKVKRHYFDGLKFHRVIAKFMIQGGCPLGTGTGSPGFKFEDEINAKSLGLDKLKVSIDGKPHPWLLIRSNQQFQQQIVQPLLTKHNIRTQEELKAKKDLIDREMAALTLDQAYANMGYKYNDKLKSHKPMRGVIAMANSGPNTNGSQFFINLVDTPHLTGKHTVFGKVVKGMTVVDEIGKVKVGAGAKPVDDVKIVSIRLKKPAP
jgi:cyclophilin family peptidyl-prolyl cis-trans isomerase